MTTIGIAAVIHAFLLPAGTAGRKQSEIFSRLRQVPREDVLAELDTLWRQEMVQRFTVPQKIGKPYVVWRATDKFNV